MHKIESFKVNHLELRRGVYISRKDTYGENKVTTVDIRVCKPYDDQPMPDAAMHTIEHIGATFFRMMSSVDKDTIYFGPMGCHTGFYLILNGDYTSHNVLPAVKAMFKYVATFEGPIPGATEKECGNYNLNDLKDARRIAHKFLNETLIYADAKNLNYPSKE